MNKLVQVIGLVYMAFLVAYIASGYSQKEHAFQADAANIEQPTCVVKVAVTKDRSGSAGSGVLIRSDLVLTCHHTIRETRPGDSIQVEFRDGLKRTATIARVDKDNDLAVLRIIPVLTPAAKAASRPVIKNQDVVICGFPGGREYDEVRGRVADFRKDTFSINQPAVGMSGGPVFNMGGEVVGVMFGNLVNAHCVGLEVIRDFLKEL